MFHDIVDDPGSLTPAELRELYEAELLAVLESHGVAEVAARSGVDESTLRALEADDSPELTLEEAAAVLAVLEETPDAETIATTSRDALLMGMTTAVLDVEAVESGLGGRLEAREIQSKVEGRFPITLEEFALLQQYIESKT
ncbi:DUF5791 family protein [Natronomonas marina]|jgi:hypothetical protein|uniref:DUF5791 family protein n=1 Tax=Natronomonas marina TaxID=2961939 RepID=UPI0020C954F0|nr:DUF5791 family protein [Natronomonas marina]